MQIKERNIDDLIPADYNPRKKSGHVLESIKGSLKDYGWLAPVVVNTHPGRENIIVGGHRRLEAARANGEKTVPTIEVNLTIEQEKQANLRLNAQESFEPKGLSQIIAELHAIDEGITKTLGFSDKEIADLLYQAKYNKGSASGILAEKFLIPPFSVFDSKQGDWQKRKKAWLEILGDLAESRVGTLAKGEHNVMMMYGSGVSSFDPVTSEIAYRWFAPQPGGTIIDPFAGSLARGGVAAALGYEYHGIDIRADQIEINKKQLEKYDFANKAHFYAGNSLNLSTLIPEDVKADLIFTCPPYYDLEIYSEGEGDLSAKKSYQEFMQEYEEIFRQAAARLKDNRFAVIVIGDIRDDRGIYRDFISDNIAVFKRLGFHLYNEIIYLQALATAPHRAERNMQKRKVVKVHQSILTMYKGDPKLLENPALMATHLKVLTFLKGDPEKIKGEYKNPPDIKHDVFAALEEDPEATE
jgi:16S rRNA G966 N2-methylase RsmD